MTDVRSLPHSYLVFLIHVVFPLTRAQFGGMPGMGLGVPGMHGGLATMGPMGRPMGGGMPFGGPMGGSPGTFGSF